MRTLLTIILPTYNEVENVCPLLFAIRETLGVDVPYEVIFVDDSNDKTPEIISGEMLKDCRVRLIHRKPRDRTGLATAFVTGFAKARGKYICCMDSDLQHPPAMIIQLLEKIVTENNDIVVASRYLYGGSADGLGGKYRKFVSIVSKYVAHIILEQTRRSSDPGSGFFVFRKSILKGVTLSPRGFKILIELLVKTNTNNVSEMPFHFLKRENNNSKATLHQGLEYLQHLWKLFRTVHCTNGFIKNVSRFVNKKNAITFFIIMFTLVWCLWYLTQGQFVLHSLALVSLFLSSQGLYALFLMLYAWEDPERSASDKSPTKYHAPHLSFTALVPVRHEEVVIKDTLRAISSLAYPSYLTETIVICSIDDVKTIRAVKTAISKFDTGNISLAVYSKPPINKPHGLNEGLRNAKNDVVVIFDAEDEPHKDIYNIVNTVMLRDKVDVVQSGVQLMNYRSRWFSIFNVMEYYFWFKSSLHFYARAGVVPLGGNTVFFKRERLLQVGGWDPACLTEDADIGLRLSKVGAKIRVVYDEQHTTQEETPPTVVGLVKQRTRWNQGFLQILLKGDWLSLPYLHQRLLALYIFLWPVINATLFLYVPFSIWWALVTKMPVFYAILLNAPLYILVLHLTTFTVCQYEFTKSYKLKYSFWMPLQAIIFYYPYQLLLGYSALRAVGRLMRGDLTWEKTQHINAHRIALEQIDEVEQQVQTVFTNIKA